MADRIIRDELWQSIRWLDLPSDTHRLVFNSLLHIADDFGNLEGGSRRLYRWMEHFCQVKTEADAIKVMSDLQDADLVRRYEVDGRELWHLPRFKAHRQYLTRRCPTSPWEPVDNFKPLGKEQRKERRPVDNSKTRRVVDRGLAKDQTLAKKVVATSQLRSSDVAEGVGVGVGVGEVQDKGLSISPTRGREVKVKPVYKKSSKPQRQRQTEDPVERNRRIANAVVSGDLELARAIKAGRA